MEEGYKIEFKSSLNIDMSSPLRKFYIIDEDSNSIEDLSTGLVIIYNSAERQIIEKHLQNSGSLDEEFCKKHGFKFIKPI